MSIRAGEGVWGEPPERDPMMALRDVIEGLISVEATKEIHGVVIDPCPKTF